MHDGDGLFMIEPRRNASTDAITVLCLPGTMCSPRIFDGLGELGTRVVAGPWLEWPPPHDMASIATAVAALAARHAPVVLLGHSTGGVLALSAALRADPGAILGLVTCDSGANMLGHGDVDAIIDRVRSDWGPSLWAAIAQRSVHKTLAEPVMAELSDYPSRISAHAVEAALRSQRDTDLQPELHRLAALPTLVVHGRHDTARTIADAEQLATGMDPCELAVLECGHTPPVEVPQLFARTVRRWLRHVTDERAR